MVRCFVGQVSVINEPSLFSVTLTNVLYLVYSLFLCVRSLSMKERSLSDNSLVRQCRSHVTRACLCVCVTCKELVVLCGDFELSLFFVT